MTNLPNREAIRIPVSKTKKLRRVATAARIGTYVAPVAATILLFTAKNEPAFFWWAGAALLTSILLQIGKDWWEKVLEARREPDGRGLSIALAQFALTSAALLNHSHERAMVLSKCRQHLMVALGIEYAAWEGSAATLHLLGEQQGTEPITVEVGQADGFEPELESDLDWVISRARENAISEVVHRSLVAVPVVWGAEPQGVLTLSTSEAHSLTQKDAEIVRRYADMIAITFEVEGRAKGDATTPDTESPKLWRRSIM